MNKSFAINRLYESTKIHSKRLHIKNNVNFIPNNLDELSQVYVDENDKICIDVVIGPDFFNPEKSAIDEYDFIEAMIATAHEMHHGALLSETRKPYFSRCDKKLAESYVSRCYNNDTYCYDYDKFSYEIAAERYALHNTYEFLHKKIPEWETVDEFLLDYVNARAVDDRWDKSEPRKYPYFIQTDTRFTSMEEVFDAFDKAYENSFKVKKDFEYSTENSNPELNVVKSVLDEYPDLKAGFDNAVDGEEQTHFAACIVYSKHKELGRETKALKNNDYNLSQIRNATFRERVRNADIPSLDFDSDGCEEDFTDDNYRL